MSLDLQGGTFPFSKVSVKLTPKARNLLSALPEGITTNGDYIEGTFKDITALRLHLLSTLSESTPDADTSASDSKQFTKAAQISSSAPQAEAEAEAATTTPKRVAHSRVAANFSGSSEFAEHRNADALSADGQATGKQLENLSHGHGQKTASHEDSAISSVKSGPYFIDEFLYLYEKIVLKSVYLEELQKKNGCVIQVISRHEAPSLTDHYAEVHVTQRNDMVLNQYIQFLENLRKDIATVVIPLPSHIVDSKQANTLESLAQAVHLDEKSSTGKVSASPNQANYAVIRSTSHVDLVNRVLIHHCRNEVVERADFRIRRLIKDFSYDSARFRFQTIPFDHSIMGFFSYPNAQPQVKASCLVVVCNNDMIRVPADIYVNSLSQDLALSGGLALALSTAAGSQLQDGLNRAKAELQTSGNSVRVFRTFSQGPQNLPRTGDIVCTSGYKLPCDYVLHAVSPRGDKVSTSGEFSWILSQIYFEVLEVAIKLYPEFVHSIAIPLLSAGALRKPHRLQDCVVALTGALERAASQGVLSHFKIVYLVNVDTGATKLLLSELSKSKLVAVKHDLHLLARGTNPCDMIKMTTVRSSLAADRLYSGTVRQSFAAVSLPDVPTSEGNPPKLSAFSLGNSAASGNASYTNQLTHIGSASSSAGASLQPYMSIGAASQSQISSMQSTSFNAEAKPAISGTGYVSLSTSLSSNSSAASNFRCAASLSCARSERFGTSLILSCQHSVCVACYELLFNKRDLFQCKICRTVTCSLLEHDLKNAKIYCFDGTEAQSSTSVSSRCCRVEISVEYQKCVWVTLFPNTGEGRQNAQDLKKSLERNIFKYFLWDSTGFLYCWEGYKK